MELKHLTKLTCSILCLFLMNFAQDGTLAATSFSRQVNNHKVLLGRSAHTPNKNIFDVENAKTIQLQNVQKAKENLGTLDATIRWRTSEPIGTNSWSSANNWRRKRWSGLTEWEKRSPEVTGADMNFPESLDLYDKRKWSQFSSWGKRHRSASGGDPADKRWKEMSVWGKRDDGTDKRWKEMSVWGKRDDIENLKRWKEMSVWGKRQGIEDKSWREMASWGNRKPEDPGKKWKSISAWGKRTSDNQFDATLKEMAALGTRENNKLDRLLDNRSLVVNGKDKYQNKKWKQLVAWGKRNVEPLDIGKWDDIGLWGKRSLKHIRNWRDMDMWGKRPSWSKTGFTSWGKRSHDVNINSD